jgi:hypothetical protein
VYGFLGGFKILLYFTSRKETQKKVIIAKLLLILRVLGASLYLDEKALLGQVSLLYLLDEEVLLGQVSLLYLLGWVVGLLHFLLDTFHS